MTDNIRNDDQYKTLCDNCECVLSEDVSIECLSRGDEEQTWCMGCWDDLCDEMRAEGWVAQGDEDDEDEAEAYFDRKYPKAKCHRCETAVSGATVVYCGGGGGACETWFCAACHADGTHDCCADDEEDDEEEDDVDDVDAPNHFPYKMCSECSERKSCGSYNADMKWLCETCCAHVCRSCGETMTHARFEDGKMCCDAPLFEGDESESEAECENCACRLGTVISEGKEALLLCQTCYEDEPNWAHTRSVRKDEK
jgi:hypothetical protein